MKNSVTYSLDDNNLIIKIKGRIDAANAESIREEIKNIRNQFQDKTVIFDLDDLNYLASAGIRLFLITQKEEIGNGGITLINLNPDVYNIFEMTGLTTIIPIERK